MLIGVVIESNTKNYNFILSSFVHFFILKGNVDELVSINIEKEDNQFNAVLIFLDDGVKNEKMKKMKKKIKFL